MAKIPNNRVVSVSVSKNTAFPSRTGFGNSIVLTTDATGAVNATDRVKGYAEIDEVSADFATSSGAYKAVEKAFSQDPRPLMVKVGFVDPAVAVDAGGMKTELAAVQEYDGDFYWVTIDDSMRDTAALDGLVEWTEAQSKISIIDTNDAGHEDKNNTTCLAARHKGTVERSAVFYHTDPEEFGAISLAAYCASRIFDQADSAYTANFKFLRSLSPVNLSGSKLEAVTGMVPQLGQDKEAGHCTNTYVDIGGRNVTQVGSTLTPNVFIDEIHTTDYIIARTEEALLGILFNNARIPFTDEGMQLLASGVREVMSAATRAGLIAEFEDQDTGDLLPAFTITVPSVNDIPEVQRKNRIAPAIKVQFRYAGAVHYTTVNYNMTF